MKLCTVFLNLAVGTVLFCGTLPRAAAADEPLPADVIIYNAKVLTVNSNFAVAQAIAIRGNQIVAIGKDKQVQHFKGFETHSVDAKGCTVMPGIYDNLADPFQASVSELDGPQPNFDSIATAREFIRAQAAAKKPGEWIVVERAWPTRLKEGRLPTKAELDSVAPKNPVYWNSGVVAMVNSKALEVSRITSLTTNPPGGEIVIDPASHKPTGLLRNAAILLKLPPVGKRPSLEQRRAAVKHLFELYNRQGITSVASRGESETTMPVPMLLFRKMAEAGELTVRVNCTLPFAQGTNFDQTLVWLDSLTNTPPGEKQPLGPTGAGDDWVRTGPLVVQMDGDVLSGSAYLRTPWGIGPTYQISEPAYRGQLVNEPEVLRALFTAATERGWQVAADCTGDAALDQLLNSLQKVQFKTNITQRRFMVRHASFQAEEDWDRCRKLGLYAELEPNRLYLDGSSLLKTLGEKRLKHFEAYQGWFEANLTAGAGSGHKAGLDSLSATDPWNPWLGIWITLTRQTAQNDGIYIKEQQLTREQAIRFYTINNARMHFEEEKKGSLEVGKFADLILLDRDLMKCPVNDIRDTKVQLTMVNGKVVWDAKRTEAEAISQAASASELASVPK